MKRMATATLIETSVASRIPRNGSSKRNGIIGSTTPMIGPIPLISAFIRRAPAF
jgi:hypothetical protein